MSTHINAILLNAARLLIQTHAAGNQYHYVLDDVALNSVISMPTRSGIEDTGKRIDLSLYESVNNYLWQPAGPEYGASSLHDVLMERLTEVAGQHRKKPGNAVSKFIGNLKYKPIGWLLKEDTDVVVRDAKLRRRLKKLGYRLRKDRTTRNPFDSCYQYYTIIHEETHEVNIDAPTNLAGLEQWV